MAMNGRCAVRGARGAGASTASHGSRAENDRSREPRTAHRAPFGLLLLATLLPASVSAQPASDRASPWYVSVSHYGRWGALGGAGALLVQGAMKHNDADQAYSALIEQCRVAPLRCDKLADGRYADADMEGTYQQTRTMDHRARNWILAGEVTLLAAGTMFLLDLVYHDTGPKNIPFSPFEVYAPPGQLGVTLRF